MLEEATELLDISEELLDISELLDTTELLEATELDTSELLEISELLEATSELLATASELLDAASELLTTTSTLLTATSELLATTVADELAMLCAEEDGMFPPAAELAIDIVEDATEATTVELATTELAFDDDFDDSVAVEDLVFVTGGFELLPPPQAVNAILSVRTESVRSEYMLKFSIVYLAVFMPITSGRRNLRYFWYIECPSKNCP